MFCFVYEFALAWVVWKVCTKICFFRILCFGAMLSLSSLCILRTSDDRMLLLSFLRVASRPVEMYWDRNRDATGRNAFVVYFATTGTKTNQPRFRQPCARFACFWTLHSIIHKPQTTKKTNTNTLVDDCDFLWFVRFINKNIRRPFISPNVIKSHIHMLCCYCYSLSNVAITNNR